MTTPPLPLPQIDPCVFCEIIAKRSPAKIVHEWHDALAIVPLNPVTDGHTLVIPRIHVADVGQDPHVSAAAMRRAAELAATQWCNVITSRGRAATQSVLHLHYHVIPRTEGDGLALPWDDGHRPTHVRATHAEARLDLCRKALLLDGYFTPDEIGPDVAPRIAERLGHLRGERDRLQTELAAVDRLVSQQGVDYARDLTQLHTDRDRIGAVVLRIEGLRDRWCGAGPPLGTSTSRWWDQRMRELDDALDNPGQPAPPRDGTCGYTHAHERCVARAGHPGDHGPWQKLPRPAPVLDPDRIADGHIDADNEPEAAVNPPGSTREQLPADILALALPLLPPYSSTACITATACERAHQRHPHMIGLLHDADDLHARCRLNHKFTGQLCGCGCHGAEDASTSAGPNQEGTR